MCCGCDTTYKFQNWKELKGNCNNGSVEHLFLFDALCSSEDLMVKTIAKINYCKSIIGTHTLHLSFCCCSATLNRYINFMQLMSFPFKDASYFWYYLPIFPWQTVDCLPLPSCGANLARKYEHNTFVHTFTSKCKFWSAIVSVVSCYHFRKNDIAYFLFIAYYCISDQSDFVNHWLIFMSNYLSGKTLF